MSRVDKQLNNKQWERLQLVNSGHDLESAYFSKTTFDQTTTAIGRLKAIKQSTRKFDVYEILSDLTADANCREKF